MAVQRWERGVDGQAFKNLVRSTIPAGTAITEQRILDTKEVIQYDDVALSGAQRAAINSLMNSNGFTNVS